MDNLEIKKKIIEIFKLELEKKLKFLNEAINKEQKESASHIGKMESRYDTFKEEAQAVVAAHEKQLSNFKELFKKISEIPLEIYREIEFGSIVETNENNYFFSAAILNEVEVSGVRYRLISKESPIGQMFLNKKVGDEFEFRGKKIKIRNIF